MLPQLISHAYKYCGSEKIHGLQQNTSHANEVKQKHDVL